MNFFPRVYAARGFCYQYAMAVPLCFLKIPPVPLSPRRGHLDRLFLLLAAWLCLTAIPVQAQTGSVQPGNGTLPPVQLDAAAFSLATPVPPLPQGSSALLAVTLTPEAGWYFYANTPGALGQPTRLTAMLGPIPAPFPALYPAGHEKPDPFGSGELVRTYDGPTRIFLPLPPGADAVSVTAELLLCSATNCLPVKLTRTVTTPADPSMLPAAQTAPWWPEVLRSVPETPATQGSDGAATSGSTPLAPRPEFAPRYHEQGLEVGGLAKAALLAFLAGMLLNLMPCVLPVASLKLKGLLSGCGIEGHPDPVGCFRAFNLYFALGVISWFVVLAMILASLELAWGQIFQSQATVLALAVLVFALSLSLFGVFTLPVIDLKAPVAGKSSRGAAFFSGCLATLLATPCSGPFLGGVLAWTLTQPAPVVAAVFACIGLGMASPYLVMCVRPQVLFIFNLPGTWTLFVERLAGFFLAATAVYLLNTLPAWTLGRAMILLLTTALAAWIWGGWTSLSKPLWHRLSVRSGAFALVVAAWAWAAHPPLPDAAWEPYEPEAFEEMLGTTPVLADFTADWCPNCKFLEFSVLTEENLSRWKRRYGMRFVKVDLTRENRSAQALLEAMGSRSIPVVAIFPAGEKSRAPMVLRDLFTLPTLEKVLERELGPASPGK